MIPSVCETKHALCVQKGLRPSGHLHQAALRVLFFCFLFLYFFLVQVAMQSAAFCWEFNYFFCFFSVLYFCMILIVLFVAGCCAVSCSQNMNVLQFTFLPLMPLYSPLQLSCRWQRFKTSLYMLTHFFSLLCCLALFHRNLATIALFLQKDFLQKQYVLCQSAVRQWPITSVDPQPKQKLEPMINK